MPPRPWTWLTQVHGADVVVVDEPGQHAGARADAAVTARAGCTLLVRTADCVPLVLRAPHAVGVVHAGWRGLRAGIVEAAVEALDDLSGGPLTAEIGPCISAGQYEFAGPERDELVDRYGHTLAATTAWGTPALDMVAGVTVALAGVGVTHVDRPAPACTASSAGLLFSHRARGDAGRLAAFAWVEP